MRTVHFCPIYSIFEFFLVTHLYKCYHYMEGLPKRELCWRVMEGKWEFLQFKEESERVSHSSHSLIRSRRLINVVCLFMPHHPHSLLQPLTLLPPPSPLLSCIRGICLAAAIPIFSPSMMCINKEKRCVSIRGVTQRCRLPWLTNNTLVYEPKCGGGGGGLLGLSQWV